MLQIAEVHQFIVIFAVAKKSGGDSVEIIRKAITTLCEKMEVEQEIQVGLSAKRLEFRVMSGVPIGILLYMRVSFTTFMEILYGSILGIFIMAACLGVYILAFLWGNKIIKIEV